MGGVQAGTVLGFDFGTRRIGVAVGEPALRHAHALLVIDEEANVRRFERIGQLIKEWQPARLVVGLPVHLDGTAHDLTARARRFGNQLHGRFGLPVDFADERLTSVDAEARLRDVGLDARSSKTHVDALAAQLILEGYFNAHA